MMKYDLVIVGAGLVGSSLAAALLRENFTIAIIDKAPAPENSVLNFNSRAIALSWSSIQLLKRLGVWSSLLMEESMPENINEVQVSEQSHFSIARIRAEDFAVPYLGAVVNADSLNFNLNRYLIENNSGIDFFRQTDIKRIEKKANAWELELSDGNIIQGSLSVGADGSDSFVRKQQGIGLRVEPQLHTAIVVNVSLNQDHVGVAYERFLKEGTIAMLPFGEKRVKCVWIAANAEAQVLKEKTDKEFLKELQKIFGFRLGMLHEIGKRFSYPIQVSTAENIYGQAWVLIGNAANTLSPVAAQGFNLGLRDACTLAEELIKAKKSSGELQGVDFLQQYAEKRLADQARVKQFTQQLELGGAMRRLGILACEFISPLKHWVGQLGMGMKVE